MNFPTTTEYALRNGDYEKKIKQQKDITTMKPLLTTSIVSKSTLDYFSTSSQSHEISESTNHVTKSDRTTDSISRQITTKPYSDTSFTNKMLESTSVTSEETDNQEENSVPISDRTTDLISKEITTTVYSETNSTVSPSNGILDSTTVTSTESDDQEADNVTTSDRTPDSIFRKITTKGHSQTSFTGSNSNEIQPNNDYSNYTDCEVIDYELPDPSSDMSDRTVRVFISNKDFEIALKSIIGRIRNLTLGDTHLPFDKINLQFVDSGCNCACQS